MLERDIEAYLVKRVKDLNGIAYKFTSPQRRSVPDRMVILNRIPAFFIETKATGCKATESQLREHAKLEALGKHVYVCDSKEAVDKVLGLYQ